MNFASVPNVRFIIFEDFPKDEFIDLYASKVPAETGRYVEGPGILRFFFNYVFSSLLCFERHSDGLLLSFLTVLTYK